MNKSLIKPIGLAIFALVVLVLVSHGISQRMERQAQQKYSTPATTVTVTPSLSSPRASTSLTSTSVKTPPPPSSAPSKHQPTLAAQDYVVKPGDTLWSISGQFSHIPGWYPAIANASWVKNPALIFPGQVLHIPEIP